MITLYLIRHGESIWNVEGRIQGQQDPPLSALGREQARRIAARLAPCPLEAVVSSDLARARETADAIAAPHGLAPTMDARLREAAFGDWEGLTVAEIDERWPNILAGWRADPRRVRPPGAETLEQVMRRAGAALSELVARHSDGTLALVGHGGSVRAIVAHALGATPAVFRRLRLDNGSITTLEVRDGAFTLRQLNETCHLGTEPSAPLTGPPAADYDCP